MSIEFAKFCVYWWKLKRPNQHRFFKGYGLFYLFSNFLSFKSICTYVLLLCSYIDKNVTNVDLQGTIPKNQIECRKINFKSLLPTVYVRIFYEKPRATHNLIKAGLILVRL